MANKGNDRPVFVVSEGRGDKSCEAPGVLHHLLGQFEIIKSELVTLAAVIRVLQSKKNLFRGDL